MGNPDGRTWLTKTQKQKQGDIQKYFIDSKIRILENKINNIKNEIKDCEDQIGQLIRPVLQEEIIYTKNSAKKVKEKIKEVQGKIILFKARRKGQERRAKNRIKREFEEYQKTLLTEQQMIDIIKNGTICEDINGRRISRRCR